MKDDPIIFGLTWGVAIGVIAYCGMNILEGVADALGKNTSSNGDNNGDSGTRRVRGLGDRLLCRLGDKAGKGR